MASQFSLSTEQQTQAKKPLMGYSDHLCYLVVDWTEEDDGLGVVVPDHLPEGGDGGRQRVLRHHELVQLAEAW